MTLELNPRLLDVVEFDNVSKGRARKITGTIVETFGDPARTFLIEMADAEGVPYSFVTQEIDDIKQVWSAQGVGKTPNLPEAQLHFEQGILFLQNGLLGSAKGEFAKAFALNQNLRASLLNATNDLAQKGKLDAAIRIYALILELQPQYENAKQNLSAGYVQRGIRLGRSGLLHKAIEDFNAALMLRPTEDAVYLIRRNLVAAYTQLGVWHSDKKQYSEAVTYFMFAFELDPSDPTQRNVGVALVASSAAKTEPESPLPGLDFFRQAIQMGLTLSECLNCYGATLARHGRIVEARRALRAAVEADPQNEVARSNFETISSQDIPEGLMLGLIPLEPQELRIRNA
jgi:tetratricopeptide (TPR) repeat protein